MLNPGITLSNPCFLESLMKNKLVYIILFVCFSLFAQEATLNGPENFSFTTTIKYLNFCTVSELNSLMENETWLLLDGSLSSLTLLSAKGEEYLLEALLVQGEWKEMDEVLKYECKLIFKGDYWENIVPERTPRKVSEDMILLNSHVLVLGKVIGHESVENTNIPYIKVNQIRIIP